MNNFVKKSQNLCTFFPNNFNFHRSLSRSLSFQLNSFFIQLFYFIILSLFGYLGLKFSKPRTCFRPKDFDLFYTSVSASTVSSMTSIEMEVFSNFQLILLTFLMLAGGEVFTSMLQLFLARFSFTQNQCVKNEYSSTTLSLKHDPSHNQINQIELGLVSIPHHSENHTQNHHNFNDKDKLKYNSLRYLSYVVLGYLMLIHFFGFSLVTFYLTYIPSAKYVLKNKGIKIETFSLFLIVSTFASCGYVPTNENLIVFKKNSGLLLLILPHVLFGNTLYPPCLRLFLKVMKSVTKREEFSYLLKNSKEIGYDHLLSGIHCWFLLVTVFGFIVIQLVLFCSMEWNSNIMEGLNPYQKLVASLFQVTNARHSGESVFDLSAISSAILVIFIVMIAYGNVGFSTGYSCSRQLNHNSMCKDSWIGFSGKWSTKGKFILILVMFFGRLKKFNMNGGKAWHLS
ncbi:cation transporter HKT1;3-like isoform X2 [Cicer arietinum]|uniref:Sodium transporter HKT1-like isoform X2 n=1 Tax=Cicer arietinum TaxID=3827 RepID=A0A1S2Z143_CICAR|nr:sodium transporter HKT1-like isoform X2 [Cicer arietinum]